MQETDRERRIWRPDKTLSLRGKRELVHKLWIIKRLMSLGLVEDYDNVLQNHYLY